MVSIRSQGTPAVTIQAERAGFDIFQDDSLGVRHLDAIADKDINSFPRALGELAIGNCQNISPRSRDVSDVKLINKAPIEQHVTRLQRPALSAHTFEPLASLEEKDEKPVRTKAELKSSTSDSEQLVVRPSPPFQYSIQEQVQKQLAGQFEWLISIPAKANPSAGLHQSQLHASSGEADTAVVYGCNLLRSTPKSVSCHPTSAGKQSTNRVTVLATPISGNIRPISQIKSSVMSLEQRQHPDQLPPPPDKAPSLKVSEMVGMVEHALSPDFSGVSEPNESLAGSSRTASFSLARIDDSVEELDVLQENLETVDTTAKVKHVAAANPEPIKPAATKSSTGGSPSVQSSQSVKRASTVSLKDKASQSLLRQSEPMSLRQKRQQTMLSPSKKLEKPAIGGRNRLSLASTPARSPTSKSSKPPTVAKFELPGEAVARRLREQREARQALIEKAEKANTAPPKPRTLTKPSFELPGEAISRRKREQLEAKLRAEEEELRKKREFKARPIRNSSAPGTVPRETITTKARQAKQEEEAKAKNVASTATIKGKRMSMQPTVGKAATLAAHTNQRPRSSLSSASKTMRRDSTITNGVNSAKVRAKPKQDTGVKSAREQAAERSRAASREWAEKKRRQNLVEKGV